VRDDADALELLESEDLELRELFTELRQRRGNSVEDRAEYGDVAKEIVRHAAVREAALVDVGEVASDAPGLSELASRIEHGSNRSRPHIDRVERMSRGVQGINLRTGQDFDAEIEELIQLVHRDRVGPGRGDPRAAGVPQAVPPRTGAEECAARSEACAGEVGSGRNALVRTRACDLALSHRLRPPSRFPEVVSAAPLSQRSGGPV
jgi:hypothetical protein